MRNAWVIAILLVARTAHYSSLASNLRSGNNDDIDDDQYDTDDATPSIIDWTNKKYVLSKVKREGEDLEFASDELKNDREVVLAAVQKKAKL